MILQAFFGSAQTGLGYQFYGPTGTLLGTRITSGITALPEAGGYVVDATVPSGAAGVYWNSASSSASEDLRDALAASISGDPWLTVVPGSYAAGTAGDALGRLNILPADNPVAVAPAPPSDPDLCLCYVDAEAITGAVLTDLEITINLKTPRPALSEAGRLVSSKAYTMAHLTGTPGRYTLALESGLSYRATCSALWAEPLDFTIPAATETLNLADA